MSLFQFPSLRWRLVAVMCLAYVIVAAISLAVGYSTQQGSLHGQLEERARADAAILAAGAVSPLNLGSRGDYVALNSFLSSLKQAQGVRNAQIWGPDGCLVAPRRNTGAKAPCRSYNLIARPTATSLSNGDVTGVAPIAPAGESTYLGYATVTLSGGSLQQDLRNNLLLEAVVRFLGLLIFVMLSLIIAQYVLGPLTTLARAAHAIRSGQLSTRVRASGQTELTTLAESFNEMAASLEKRIQHLSLLARTGAELPATLRDPGGVEPLLARFGGALDACAAGFIGDAEAPWWTNESDECRIAAERAGLGVTTTRNVDDGTYAIVAIAVPGNAVFAVVRHSGHPFDHEEQQVITNFAHQIGIATDNVRLFEAQQEALHVKDQFLSIVSHELRTPLTAMKGYAQMLRRKLVDDPDSLRFAASIDAQVSRLSRLVDDLLDVTRFARGQFELTRRQMEMEPLLDDIVSRYRMIAPDHEIALDVRDIPREGYWDRDRLEQVLSNLLGNAIKYSPDGGTITVRARRDGGRMVVSVLDEGVGIPEEEQTHLFERFYRSAGTNDVKGLGLGLYVTRRVVEAHGGEVGVRSTVGKGSEFFFTLPLTEVPARAASA